LEVALFLINDIVDTVAFETFFVVVELLEPVVELVELVVELVELVVEHVVTGEAVVVEVLEEFDALSIIIANNKNDNIKFVK
jgi:hypothetical protein